MSKTLEISLVDLLAEQHEAGRGYGYDEGYEHGCEDAQARMVQRAQTFIAERIRQRRAEGKPEETDRFDTTIPVLRELVERLEATVEDVTPTGVDRG